MTETIKPSETIEQKALRLRKIADDVFGSKRSDYLLPAELAEFARRLTAEQGEPVAWGCSDNKGEFSTIKLCDNCFPLYTSPPSGVVVPVGAAIRGRHVDSVALSLR